MNAPTGLIHTFARLLEPADENTAPLNTWITSAQSERHRDAVNAALTCRYHNGGTEGVNNKTKLIKRQIYDRAQASPFLVITPSWGDFARATTASETDPFAGHTRGRGP